MRFSCIQDCSQCCVEREYYPSKKFGKIGVLILPDEKKRIESLARDLGIKIKILPRIGISDCSDRKKENNKERREPSKIIAYQLMGMEKNGNTCPFLDTESEKRSPHGGYTCKIYKNRPLACAAYPLIETNPITIDKKCKFCKEYGQATADLESEIISLVKIKSKMNVSAVDSKSIWRYATGIGDDDDKDKIQSGWMLER